MKTKYLGQTAGQIVELTLRTSNGAEKITLKESALRFPLPTSVQCRKRLNFVKVVSTKQLRALKLKIGSNESYTAVNLPHTSLWNALLSNIYSSFHVSSSSLKVKNTDRNIEHPRFFCEVCKYFRPRRKYKRTI